MSDDNCSKVTFSQLKKKGYFNPFFIEWFTLFATATQA
jgi:hypothetical protein